LGIHNLEVRIDGPELPGLDGSALPYYEAMKPIGTVDQGVPARVIAIDGPVSVSSSNAHLVAVAGRGLRVSYTLNYDSVAASFPTPTQYLSIELDEETFAREIAPARTFCFEYEARELQKAGLGKGANTQNTLVLGNDGGVLENEFRFPDELVRHKILDLIGDLYLTNARIQGHVLATKSGHDLNVQLAQALDTRAHLSGVEVCSNGAQPVSSDTTSTSNDASPSNVKSGPTTREVEPSDPVGDDGLPRHRGHPYGFTGRLDLGIIQEVLPHRYPFLLVDRVLEVSPEGDFCRAIKNVTVGEEHFLGHFPGNPVMPGVLQIEGMAQAAGVMLLSHRQNAGRTAYLLSLDKVKFRRKIVPGDQVVFESTLRSMKPRTASVDTRALVDGELAAEAHIRFMIVDA
ncbi:MAG: 3-hydroxyacyl-ACP dehydratase FabZ, partial [Planctomycetota bacterium]